MINLKLLRKNLKYFIDKLSKRDFYFDLKNFKKLEKKRKILQKEFETLQKKKNLQSKKILLNRKKKNFEKIENLKKEAKEISKKLSILKQNLKKVNKKILKICLEIPNLPDESTTNKNLEIYKWGNLKNFEFSIKDHIKLGKKENNLDFSKASKITGSKFVVLKGKIALLNRSLIQFMLDLHTQKHNYVEINVPLIVNQFSLYGTGQLPKFDQDLFHIQQTNTLERKYSLIPTSEVPMINLFQNEILKKEILPIKLVSYSPCFRAEAGSYGKKSKGLLRMHQFDKVELIQIVEPKKSIKALEEITKHAEKVLKLLELPYRKILLTSKEMNFSSSKTYDLEVWMPSLNNYKEVSSCSNTKDFQSRRIKIRYRDKLNKKLEFVHTLNGSGLAIGRTLASIMENYQQKNGNIKIPKILQKYMNDLEYI